jgi:hypothetical protein
VEPKANFFVKVITTLSIFASCCALAQAQPQRSGGQQPAPHVGRPSPMRSTQERWRALPPVARQDFRRNAERWMRMGPEERNLLRQRENLRRAQIQRETDAALRNSGLSLDQQKRAQFESRYMQERRRMEQTLRQQIENERQQQIPALIQQLRREFQLEPNSSATARPAESPKSGK